MAQQSSMVLRFALAFMVLAGAFSVLSFGVDHIPPPWVPGVDEYVHLVLHMVIHFAFGSVVALPSRRLDLMAAGGVGAVVIDVDHFGWMLGLPMEGRAAHSLFFVVAIGIVMSLLATRGMQGPRGKPALIVGAVASASVLSHMAVDAVLPERWMPVFGPFIWQPVELTPVWGLALMVSGFALVWSASLLAQKYSAVHAQEHQYR